MKLTSIGFIGGGRITRIILQAMANRQIEPASVQVCDTSPDVLRQLQRQFPHIQTSVSWEPAAGQELLFIALHPPVIMETLEQIRASVPETTQVLSLAPKISIGKMASRLPTKHIARMIPNATSYINQGYNPVSFSMDFTPGKKQALLRMLEALGHTFEVEEAKLEAYALVSAMLPTYFWFQWKQVQDLGLQMGLNEAESRETMQQSLSAAIGLLYDSGLDYEEVVDLIPVRPIGDHEADISGIYRDKLMGLYEKIKPA